MIHTPTRRLTSGAAVVAILLAALSPLVAVSSAGATAGGYPGVATGDPWVDSTLAYMTEDVAYSSTLTLPSTNGPWGNVAGHNLPAGLSMSLAGDILTVFGTPTDGGTMADFNFDADGGDGAHTSLTFSEIFITPGVPASSTTIVSNVQASPYTGLNLTATVTGSSPTGTVDFVIIGGTSIGNSPVVGGVATFTGAIDPSYIGQTISVRADYGGDLNNGYSISAPASVYIFASSTVSGTVSRNGSPLGTTVELQHPVMLTILATTTSTGGAYSFTIPGIDTLTEATTQYLIRAQVGAGYVYYATSGGPGVPNRVLTDATYTTPTTWGAGFNLYDNVAPVWSDTTLAASAVGSAYSDHVAATGTAVLHYVRTAGGLPAGLSLDEFTGEIHGTPVIEDTKTFTITASNAYGSVAHAFSMTTGPAGVAPTWSETAIDDLTVGDALIDSVTAVGDPTIVYSVSVGDLPTGLVLDPATGGITGTPTTAGESTFTLTATNAFGHVDESYVVTVAAAPELDLELTFAPGTRIGDASTEISADGLMVGSTYTLDMHSTPIRLYTGIVDATGGFTWLVTLPANTPVGAHELILTGVAPDGTVMTAHAWFTLRADGTIGAISYLGPLALAFTGSEPLLPFGLASMLILAGYLAMRRAKVAPAA